MDASLIISGYSALLATSLAVLQVIIQRRDQPKIRVEGSFIAIPHEFAVGDMVNKPRGTVVRLSVVGPEKVLEMEEVLPQLTVRNHGRRAIQLVNVEVEAIVAADRLAVIKITPDTLPCVLDPLANIEVTFQKEVLDIFDAVTFVGVVDALGRRHSLKAKDSQELLKESWNMPTRVTKFIRRETKASNDNPLDAFQAMDQMSVMTHRPRRRLPRPIVTRSSDYSLVPIPKADDEGKPYAPHEQ